MTTASGDGTGPGVAFFVPATISGVRTWAVDLSRRLRRGGTDAVLVEHPYLHPDRLDAQDIPTWGYPRLRCNTVHFPHLPGTTPSGPRVFLPDGIMEDYAACALLSREPAADLRVVGVCHSFDEWYFTTLAHFEPVIHHFVAVSEECGARLRGLLPHRADDVSVRPYAVEFPLDPHRTYAAPDAPLRLVYAGRIVETQKRVSDLLYLARELSALGVDFELRIVGEGFAKKRLLRQHAGMEAKVRDRVRIEPGVPRGQMSGLFQAADVAVLVSEYEGTSVFMLEAMAHGCVPVVTKVSGTAGVIDEGVTGFTVPVGMIPDMAARLAELARDRGLLQKMGRAGQDAARRFSYDEYMPWFAGLLDRVRGQPPRRWPDSREIFTGAQKRWLVLSRFGRIVPGLLRLWYYLHSYRNK